MREVVTEKIFSGEEDLIQISTEDRLWDLVEKMKRLEKYIPCVINDVAVIGIRAGIRFSSSDLGLSSVFLSMFLEINGISMPLGTGIQMEHKGDKASVEVFEEKCGELGSVLQANEDRIEELGNMDVKDVPGVVATLVKKNAFLPKKAAEKVLEDLRLQMTSGTGIDVYLALNQIIQVHSTMQKVSDERFLAMSEGVAKLIHTDFSKVTVLEEE